MKRNEKTAYRAPCKGHNWSNYEPIFDLFSLKCTELARAAAQKISSRLIKK